MNMRRFILTLLLLFVGSSFHAQQPPALPQKGSGPGKPLSAQEAQKLFKLDDGLRIELVACEPQVESPVAMQFDPDGRLWVVEMRDYPNGPAKGEKPAGRIRILEDKDGDGFFETSNIWADNLLFANGLLLWKDGAIVTMAPKITHLRDTKGTGKVDTENILYTGFAEQNPQLRVSHPNFGPDGWIYCANGLRGGKVVRAPSPMATKEPLGSAPVDLSGMDFRFDPINLDKYEAITGPGQFGNTFDEWGNRFVCDNRHHLRHVVMEQRYIKRNPYLAASSLLQDISVLDDGPLSSGGKVYPLSKNWTTSSLHEGRFTAACGVFIYHGNLLDSSTQRKQVPFYHGAAFTCEPTGNLVHMEIMTPKGATFEAKPHKKGVEFLATTDDWFRPVFLTHGPEGALYIADMYRAVIEHPEFMPPELKNRPDLWQGKDKGRIWRIVPKDHQTKTPRPGLSKATIPELVKTLEHAEPWHRQTAQRLLLEKNDKAMIEPLTKLLAETKSPHAKILAAWMLDGLGVLSADSLGFLLVDADPHVIEHAIRIAEPRFSRKDAYLEEGPDALVAGHLVSREPRVRFQAILSAEKIIRPRVYAIWPQIAYSVQEDPWSRLAVQTYESSSAPNVLETLAKMPIETPGARAQLRELGAIVGAYDYFPTLASAFRSLQKNTTSAKWYGMVGLIEGLDRRGAKLTSATEKAVDPREFVKMFNEADALVRDKSQPESLRQITVRVMSHAPWPTAKQTLLPLIEKEPNLELRIAALRAIAAQQDKEVPTLLMKLWPGAAPSVRREILEAMLRQPLRVNVLLDEIEAKRLRSSELDPLRTRQLMNHKNDGIRERAKKLLANNLPADRAKVLAQYQTALTLKGDAKNGREIFKKNCATCHRVAGIGIDVGPDIADTRTKTLAAMLNDILVPNSAIDANYVNYVVSTKDGRILTGLLTAETASSLTLIRAEKQADVVLRKDVDEISSTGISLMPEGLEKNISVQEMADLLGFLKNWRYLDGSVPLTP
jgi:putative membrane-bound dehydrogenase-like protein